MVNENIIAQISTDFSFILKHPDVLGLFLFGSYLTGNETPSSDKDICVVTTTKEITKLYSFVMNNLSIHQDQYDIRFFSELPLHIQGEIIDNGLPILYHDLPMLYEFLFPFRKMWEDLKFELKYCI